MSKKHFAHTKTKSITGRINRYMKIEPEDYTPHRSLFKKWLQLTLEHHHQNYKKQGIIKNEYLVNLRLVHEDEMLQFAKRFKHNEPRVCVLSFSSTIPEELELPDLGDIVMCGKFIFEEAEEWQVDYKNHWAHLFIHSVLHILGWEHGDEMEEIENVLLQQAGINAVNESHNQDSIKS